MDSTLGMIRGGFLTAKQRRELVRITRRSSAAHGVARRANAILLLDDGKSCTVIAEFLYLDDDTIREWHKRYVSGGWNELERFDWKGSASCLTVDQETALTIWLEDRLCRDSREIRDYIATTWNVFYSQSGCTKLLRRLGFEYRKPKTLPAVADVAEQQSFIDMYENLQRTLPDDEAIYFADAVHPEYQNKPAFGWIRKGSNTAIKTTVGRSRVNIHGALCLETFAMPFMEVEAVNADSSIALLEKLEVTNRDKKVIHVIWDNAAYHRGEKVRQWLKRPECRIHLIRLPAYAPHLNPIERLWGVMHKYVTHNKYYKTRTLFVYAILAFLRKTIPEEWKDFRDTVTDNFRIISHQKFRVLE